MAPAETLRQPSAPVARKAAISAGSSPGASAASASSGPLGGCGGIVRSGTVRLKRGAGAGCHQRLGPRTRPAMTRRGVSRCRPRSWVKPTRHPPDAAAPAPSTVSQHQALPSLAREPARSCGAARPPIALKTRSSPMLFSPSSERLSPSFRLLGRSPASADQIDLDPDGFSDALPGAIRRQRPHPEPRRERQASAVAE